METVPFWTADHPRPADLPTGEPEGRVDVAVIGAGVTGLAAARRLARSGASVAVLDERSIGEGASAINGGMLIYGLKASQADVIRRFGDPLAAELWQASLASIDLVEQISLEEGIDCDFARDGAAALGLTERDVSRLRSSGEWMEETLGYPTEFLEGTAVGRIVGGGSFTAALAEQRSAGVHPAKYTFGLAESVARMGVRLVEGAEVTGIKRHLGGFRLTTSKGMLEAGEVLVATNGYTGTRFPEIRRGVIPVGSYSVVTEPLPDEVADGLIPGRHMLWTSRRFLNYFRLTPDNRLLMGGRANLDPYLDLLRSGDILRQTIVRYFPDLRDAAVTHSWGGRLAVTFDLLPHIGRVDGVWYAMGYGGHGLGIGTYVGNEAAGLMSGELARSPFEEIPHPKRFYYRRRPWFLPAAALLYRTLDRFGR
jgi:glycine/D-amino acid oxidase-like deaminating enzyme